MTDVNQQVQDIVSEVVRKFLDAGGDPSTMVVKWSVQGPVYSIVIEGRLRPLTVADQLAQRIIDCAIRTDEYGECGYCGGASFTEPLTRESKDVPFTWTSRPTGNIHEIDCLWVHAHRLLDRDLPPGHRLEGNLHAH